MEVNGEYIQTKFLHQKENLELKSEFELTDQDGSRLFRPTKRSMGVKSK